MHATKTAIKKACIRLLNYIYEKNMEIGKYNKYDHEDKINRDLNFLYTSDSH